MRADDEPGSGLMDVVPAKDEDLLETRWQHRKTGGQYQLIAVLADLDIPETDLQFLIVALPAEAGEERLIEVMVQKSGPVVGRADYVVYRSTDTGKAYLRPRTEFLDGRFARL